MNKSNIATLTRSHRAIAHKKCARKEQIKEVIFDEDARREFLTGFHKRKLQKKEEKKSKREEREKQERLEMRREHRRTLAERAAQNAAEVEQAYGADAEWTGIPEFGMPRTSGSVDKGKARQTELEEEYEDEEQLATVTVVEDFDPATLIYGPGSTTGVPQAARASKSRSPSPSATGHAPTHASGIRKPYASTTEGRKGSAGKTENGTPLKSNAVAAKANAKANTSAKTKGKKVKYLSSAARKADQKKQRARRTEKAERAGGKTKRGAGAGKRR